MFSLSSTLFHTSIHASLCMGPKKQAWYDPKRCRSCWQKGIWVKPSSSQNHNPSFFQIQLFIQRKRYSWGTYTFGQTWARATRQKSLNIPSKTFSYPGNLYLYIYVKYCSTNVYSWERVLSRNISSGCVIFASCLGNVSWGEILQSNLQDCLWAACKNGTNLNTIQFIKCNSSKNTNNKSL